MNVKQISFHPFRLIIFLICLFASSLMAQIQSSSAVFSIGGGQSQSSSFKQFAVIGEMIVGESASNNYEQQSGFHIDLDLVENTAVPGNGTTNIATDYIYEDTMPVVQNTTYWYWIEDVSTDGETEIHEPITLSIPFEDTPVTPENYGLQQNYPNPFNPSTVISFALSEESDVEIIIYNVKGQKITTIFADHIYADQINSVVWNGEDENGKQVSSGVYFYKMITEAREYSKKMLMVK
jgi:hypothetical protein